MSGFGPENLPYGVLARQGEPPRCFARLGDHVGDEPVVDPHNGRAGHCAMPVEHGLDLT